LRWKSRELSDRKQENDAKITTYLCEKTLPESVFLEYFAIFLHMFVKLSTNNSQSIENSKKQT